jgi:glycosyltransferase involved in cell wall biosynthesis
VSVGERRTPGSLPVRVNFFFRAKRPGATYSIERLFDAVIQELPADRFIVRRLVCPFQSKGIARRLLLTIWAAAHQAEINHITGDIDFVALFMRRRRTILTFHDTFALQRLSGWRRRLYRLFWLDLPARRAGTITAVSAFTGSEIEALVPASRGKVRIVPNCLTMAVETAPRNFNGALPRLLHIGTAPNKNLDRICEALSGLACTLAILGNLSPTQTAALDRAGIDYENLVDLDEAGLREQYRRADILLYPSTYEGFGLPILEAQAMRLPVITSDLEPMRSVAGAGALLVDPLDPGAIRSAVADLCRNAQRREALVAAGTVNIEQYRPVAVAARYAALYEEIARSESRAPAAIASR